MSEFTKAERAAINAAHQAITRLCECTNWSDGPAWREAEKLERRETKDSATAKAMICKAWLDGVENPHRQASEFYWTRPGYLKAQLLGVGHAIERASHSYTGPMVREARDLCAAAVSANEAHTRRMVEA